MHPAALHTLLRSGTRLAGEAPASIHEQHCNASSALKVTDQGVVNVSKACK